MWMAVYVKRFLPFDYFLRDLGAFLGPFVVGPFLPQSTQRRHGERNGELRIKMTNYPEGMPSPQGPLCGGTNG